MAWETSVENQINGMNIAQGGTAIRYQPEKVNKLDKPLVFIGLGGTGLRIGRSIKDMFLERFNPAQTPTTGLDERLPAYTRFLAIDTDEPDMDKLGYMGVERCSIGNKNLATQLHAKNKPNLPSYISDWLNPTIESTASGVAGAQGVRQIGRFDLFSNVENVITSISTALTHVSTGTGTIQVVIAASVAGGTGAGTFMDMPYLVRYAAQKVALSSRISIMGIVVTPELHAILDPQSADVKRANGYACLKELDYWMDCENRGENFKQQYASNITVDWDKRPFDDCILLSSQNINNASYEKAYDTLRGIVAEYITNMFADEKRDQATATVAAKDFGFSYFSYRDNVKNNLATKDKDYPVFREYTAIGASNGQIPLQDMFLAENVFLFDKVEEYYNEQHTPDMYSEEVYSKFLSDIVGDRVNTLLGYIHNPEPRESTIDQIRNSANIAPHSTSIDATVTAFHTGLASRAQGTDAINEIAACVHKLQQDLVAMFKDTTKGPFYACRFIDSTPGVYVPAEEDFNIYMPHDFNLKLILESKRDAYLIARNQAKSDHNHQVSLAQNYYDEIKTRTFAPRQNGSLAANYYAACDSANQKIRRYWFCDTTVRLYDALIAKVDQLSKQIFKPLCKTLLELTKVYKAIGIYMKSADYKRKRQSYYRDIVDLDVMVNHFKNTYMTNNKITEMLVSLYEDMVLPYTFNEEKNCFFEVEPEDRWLSTDPKTLTTSNVNVRDNLERVTNGIFRDFNKCSLLTFWAIQHPNAIKADGNFDFTQIAQKFAPEMTAAASPMFLPSDNRPLNDSNTLTSEYITVPNTATGLSGALQTNNSIRKIKESALADHIFWIRSLDGVCLYHYGDLDMAEQDYLYLAIEGKHPGSHLWENKMNWKNLPNPVPRGARSEGYVNRVQEASDASMMKRIDALMTTESITVDQLTKKLYLLFNTQLTLEKAAALMNEIKANSLTDEEVERRYGEMLATRNRKQMQIEVSFLVKYENKFAGRDPQKQVIYDMLMQYPAMIDTMEKDVTALAEVTKAVEDRVKAGKNKTTLLGMAPRMADLFAFGILTRPTPMHVNYTMDGAQPQTVYNTMKDNVKYAVRYHAAYANEVCVAAKLMEMADPDHEEHGKLVQLKMLEDALASDLEGAVMELLTNRMTAFGANAQPLKKKLADARNAMQLASPMTLKMTANDKQMCLDFLQGMMDALDARAMGFGMMLA